ncbi:hypothetical protein [Spirosoma sp. KUDC1026]|nr:hypothetical protein [Spirosoma sp. KUDC1026]QKZ15114.1 hypothetical protein HU175_21815 [Spirosoma sp. KUDC1026]
MLAASASKPIEGQKVHWTLKAYNIIIKPLETFFPEVSLTARISLNTQ